MLNLKEIKKLLLTKTEGRHRNDPPTYENNGFFILIVICVIVAISSLGAGYDPLNFGTFNSTKMYRVENGDIIKMNLKKEQKDYNSKKDSLNGQSELNSKLDSQKITLEGRGKISEIRKLDYNYEIVIKYSINLFNSRKIYLRIPFGMQDDTVKNLILGDRIKFKGVFHKFQNIEKDNTANKYWLILKNCELIK